MIKWKLENSCRLKTIFVFFRNPTNYYIDFNGFSAPITIHQQQGKNVCWSNMTLLVAIEDCFLHRRPTLLAFRWYVCAAVNSLRPNSTWSFVCDTWYSTLSIISPYSHFRTGKKKTQEGKWWWWKRHKKNTTPNTERKKVQNQIKTINYIHNKQWQRPT